MAHTKDMTSQEALELYDLLEKLQGIDLDKVEIERVEALRPIDKLVEDLEKGVNLSKKRKPGAPKGNKHWKRKRKKYREYYARSGKQHRGKRLANQVQTPEGLYTYICTKWVLRKIKHFSLEEWLEVLYPVLDGRVPVFRRYSTKEGFTLGNVVMRCSTTGDVLFDGKEYLLKQSGYIL